MEFSILGPTALHVAGKAIPLGTARQRGMLAVLLYHAGEAVRSDVLVEYLWAGRTVEKCRDQIYTFASRARAALNRAGLGNVLVRVPSVSGYRLDVDPLLIDFHRFKHLVNNAREATARQSVDTAVALLSAAVELWRDEPVADLRGARGDDLRQVMKASLLDAQRALVGQELKLGRYQSALVRLEPLLRVNDLDEPLAQYWINALLATGRDDEARSFLANFRRRFRAECRVESTVDLGPPRPRAGDAGYSPPSVRGRGGVSLPGLSPPHHGGPRQLPKDISDFIGHDDLLVRLDALAEPSDRQMNIVVISGMPGVGKTTLAVHWAHRVRQHFPDGQIYLNANAYGPTPRVEPEEALGRFLQALDVPADRIPIGIEQRLDRLNRVLAGRRVLILIDNVRDSRQVRPLLTTADGCMILITSRTRLKGLSIREGIPNLTVPPLRETSSLTLLGHMVGAERSRDGHVAMRALARLSGGLPLALRIIGEHVAERPRARMADLVDELGTRLLDGDAEDDEANLRTAFAWSYEALAPDAARLFRLLGLFPGGAICPEAAAALAGVGVREAERLLNLLAKAHLVNHDTARRYRFHDVLRMYAVDRSQLEESESNRRQALRRLLDWYLLSVTNATAVLAPLSWPVPDLPETRDLQPQVFLNESAAMRWCEAERGNLLALTRWAAANGFHRHAWQIPSAVPEMLDRYGRQDDLLEMLKVAQGAAEADRHQQAQLGILNDLGAIYFRLYDYGRATQAFTVALGLAQRLGYAELGMVCSHNLATVHLRGGRVDAALGIARQVLRDCRRSGNRPGQAAALHRLGDAYRKLKRYESAAGRYRAALTIRVAIGSFRGQGLTYAALAALFLEAGDARRARESCQRALVIYEHTTDRPVECDVLVTMAEAERELGQPPDAVRHATRAVALSEGLGDSSRRCHALTALAYALTAMGQIEEARRACGQVMAVLTEVADPDAESLRRRVIVLRDSLARSRARLR
jgi:tetratricopeptide (TPR) repeat protein